MVRPDSDRPPGSGINVDTQALSDFEVAMRTGVQGNIAPNGDRLASTFATGVHFGVGNPSADVHALIAKYHECLDAINEQLYTYEMYAKVLVAAAAEISSNYQNADALAKSSLAEIETLIDTAIATANRPDPGPRGARVE